MTKQCYEWTTAFAHTCKVFAVLKVYNKPEAVQN